ncbi:hypothetical protein EKN93_10180 [Enterobacter asburiae]|uniref:hypothetical protein n=1 Tax=Enterobacter asburiae TaxID=61645 RepID=UPI000F822ABE|nr:hypothetical protein [Enterobacter asburiae]RTN32682.1 hypothetical protein EKN93_10180 [Enterobacter asburiae]HDR2410160.1 hypothetical protein [Enterobacter bugandensis]
MKNSRFLEEQIVFALKRARVRVNFKLEQRSCLKVRSLSKKYSQVVVLPYIRESGERVQSHTKNAPQDGKALPRSRNGYFYLSYKLLQGD